MLALWIDSSEIKIRRANRGSEKKKLIIFFSILSYAMEWELESESEWDMDLVIKVLVYYQMIIPSKLDDV